MQFLHIIAWILIYITSTNASSDGYQFGNNKSEYFVYDPLFYPGQVYELCENQIYENCNNQPYENLNPINTEPLEGNNTWEFVNYDPDQHSSRTRKTKTDKKETRSGSYRKRKKAKDSIIYQLGNDLVDILENNYDILKLTIKSGEKCPLCPFILYDHRATAIRHLSKHFPENISALQKFDSLDQIPKEFQNIEEIVICCGKPFITSGSGLYSHLEKKSIPQMRLPSGRKAVIHSVARIKRTLNTNNQVTWDTVMERTINIIKK